MSQKLTRGGFLTDIHFGKKANSPQHNQDCLNYLDWFCEQVKQNSCDYVAFLGDWNENRSALNIATLNFSYLGAKKLNDLGVPVFFCVGNHDLYHRHTRELYSVVAFKEFTNFTVIDQPYIEKSIADGVLFTPYMFHDEYEFLTKYKSVPFWAGHFEFQGFQITGYNVVMHTGPNPFDFEGPKHIISGHFHRRQAAQNIVYMGNCFPMDFGDAGDHERGMMVYDHNTDEMDFFNWDDCPKYTKIRLTDLLDNNVKIHRESRVHCLADVPISFEERTLIRQSYMDSYALREFAMEESKEIKTALTDTEVTIDPANIKLDSVDDLVLQMLNGINSDHINNNLLIEEYKRLQL